MNFFDGKQTPSSLRGIIKSVNDGCRYSPSRGSFSQPCIGKAFGSYGSLSSDTVNLIGKWS